MVANWDEKIWMAPMPILARADIFCYIVNSDLYKCWSFMLQKQKEASNEAILSYIRLQLFSLQDDRLCPINFKQVKRTLTGMNLGCFQMHHIGAPAKVRRGNKMLDTNDVFGNSRHDSGQIKYVFYEKGKVTWNGEVTQEMAQLACTKKDDPSFVRPLKGSLLCTESGHIDFRDLVENVPVVGKGRAAMVAIWRFLSRMPLARTKLSNGKVRWNMQEGMKIYHGKWVSQVATIERAPDLVKALLMKDGWKVLDKILGIEDVGKQEKDSKARKIDGKSDAGSVTSRASLDYREEINNNLKTTLEEIKQLRPGILPYQAFAYFIKCIPRIIGEEL